MNTFKLHSQHLEFLKWLVENYGMRLKYVTLSAIMRKHGGLSYATVWAYMEILTNYGYLKLSRHSANKRIYKVDVERFNTLNDAVEL
jgi:hypothetical protein